VLEIVTLVGVLVAAIGYFAKYATDLRLAQRNDRLERINQQLIEFYGPLLACTQSSEESWHAFRKRHRPGTGSFWRSDPPPTREDVLVWRLWITTVFMPVNERITQLVFERADLIVEPEMPRCLLAVCARCWIPGHQRMGIRRSLAPAGRQPFARKPPRSGVGRLRDHSLRAPEGRAGQTAGLTVGRIPGRGDHMTRTQRPGSTNAGLLA
jgi:hypothetical protein